MFYIVQVLLLSVAGCCLATTAPTWPTNYIVAGVLQLPYAEIKEPFLAFFDGSHNRSKISYYNGIVTTIQIGSNGISNFGKSYKIAYVTTETFTNNQTCFLVNGTNDTQVTEQTVLPDLTNFTKISTSGNESVWQYVKMVGTKKNTYTMTLQQESDIVKPVRYEMFGYDSLIGSHYDKYYIDYLNFHTDNFSDTEFDPPKGMACGDYPGPGDSELRVTMNPMQEYMHGRDEHVADMFNKFKRAHGKHYKDDHDHQARMHTFRHNVRFIHSKNRAGLGYSLAVNHFADMSHFELKRMRGYINSRKPNNAVPFGRADQRIRNLPDTVDWRLYGAVTPVKDQAVCGSCWSFGTTGTIEGTYFLKTGQLVRLSQQELMDCSWGEGNNACDGGEDFRAYEWIMKHGLATTDDYGDYLAVDGRCNAKNTTATVHIKGYKNVTSSDIEALKIAVAQEGPVSVAIDASHLSLSFYSNGVYYEPDCGNTPDSLDHAVLAVGYGVLNGQPYWLIKNSWSTYWGNDGYVLMSMKGNNCGVATDATFVTL